MTADRLGEQNGEFEDCFGSDVPAIKLGAKKRDSMKSPVQGPPHGYVRHWAQVDMTYRLQGALRGGEPEAVVRLAS